MIKMVLMADRMRSIYRLSKLQAKVQRGGMLQEF